MEELTSERLYSELLHTPELKRRLAVRIAMEILESEAFSEAYPRTDKPEELKAILTRVLWKNRVSTESGRAIFSYLAENFEGRE